MDESIIKQEVFKLKMPRKVLYHIVVTSQMWLSRAIPPFFLGCSYFVCLKQIIQS